MQKWEHYARFLWANVKNRVEEIRPYYGSEKDLNKLPKYHTVALRPQLNELGEKGWELVHMEPVSIDTDDYSVGFFGQTKKRSNVYFCVFKRPVAEE